MHDADIGWLYCNIGDCDWKTPAGPSDLTRHRYKHRSKEEKMNDQMEQVWRSKDGQCTGSKEEVEAYLRRKSPLAGMRFPYLSESPYVMYQAGRGWKSGLGQEELDAVVAFANLAPLIQEWSEAGARYGWGSWGERDLQDKFWLAYKEALKQVPQ